MLESFGEYLKKRRKAAGLTQDRLAIALSCYSPVLSGIDSVTISRWERATTEPTTERQREVISYFHDDIEKIFPFRCGRTQKFDHSQAIEYLSRHYLSSPKLGAKVGSFPEKSTGNYSVEKLTMAEHHQNYIDIVLEYEQSIYDSMVPVTKERLSGWIHQNNRLAIVCRKHGQYFGHMIVLPLKDEVFWELIQGHREEASLALDDFAAPGEPQNLYVFSLYGSSRISAGRLLMELIAYVSRHYDHINNIGALCVTSDGARLARAFHLQPSQVGPFSPKGLIRYQGREVKYITYVNQLAHILEDAGLRRLLRA